MSSGNEKERILSGLDLPTIFGGRAGDALSRLVGVPVNALAARLERGEANIVARTEGQAAFQKIVASAAAQEAIKNPEFMQRAIETFGRDLVEKQINKDKIASKALELLGADNAQQDSDESEENSLVSIDWLNHYASHAEKVSSEDMQDIWAKILAGEVRKPGQFSLSTMRILAETDSATARLFAKRVDHVFGNSIIFKGTDPNSGTIDPELHKLEHLGFLSGVSGMLKKSFRMEKGVIRVLYENTIFVVKCKEDIEKLEMPMIALTPAAVDLAKLLDRKTPSQFARHLNHYSEKPIAEIEIYSAIERDNKVFPHILIEKFIPERS